MDVDVNSFIIKSIFDGQMLLFFTESYDNYDGIATNPVEHLKNSPLFIDDFIKTTSTIIEVEAGTIIPKDNNQESVRFEAGKNYTFEGKVSCGNKKDVGEQAAILLTTDGHSIIQITNGSFYAKISSEYSWRSTHLHFTVHFCNCCGYERWIRNEFLRNGTQTEYILVE